VGVTGNDVTNCLRPWDRVLQLIPLTFVMAPISGREGLLSV